MTCYAVAITLVSCVGSSVVSVIGTASPRGTTAARTAFAASLACPGVAFSPPAILIPSGFSVTTATMGVGTGVSPSPGRSFSGTDIQGGGAAARKRVRAIRALRRRR